MAENDELTDQDQDDLVVNMVRYMLNQSISKIPIKKADLVTVCLRGKGKTFGPVYEKAAQVLKKNYGMCIYKADAVNSNKSTQFLCVARSANAASTALGEAEQKTLPVLFLVLAYIYMKGGQLSEHSVFGFLEKCGLPVCSSGTGNSGNVDHSGDDATRPFGDVRKLVLDTFAKQMYIRKTKTTTEASNEVLVTLAWGQRAELEFARRDVLEAVAQLMGRPAESFAKQFDECRQAELAASAETGAAELED